MRWEDVPCDTEARNRDGSRSGRQRSCKRVGYHLLRRRWEEHHGEPVPPGGFLCHHCDDPRCSEPRHLFLGDARANAEDAVQKGRMAGAIRPGEQHSQARLTEAQVRAIRSSGATNAALAGELGVSPSTVSRIRSGGLWSHVR